MRRFGLCLALVLLLAKPAWAGWVFTEAAVSDEFNESLVEYYQENKFAVGYPKAGQTLIMDLKANKVYVLNPKKKTYWVGTPEEMEKALLASIEDMIDEQVKDQKLSGEEEKEFREMMRAMAKSMKEEAEREKTGPRPKVEIKATGKSQTILGHKCDNYEVVVDGELAESVWVAPEIRVDKELDLEAFKRMIGNRSDLGYTYEQSPEMIDLAKKGFILKSERADGAEGVEWSKAEQKKIPEAVFQVPAGYKKATLGRVR